jgi:hypothetical protein
MPGVFKENCEESSGVKTVAMHTIVKTQFTAVTGSKIVKYSANHATDFYLHFK